MMTRGSCCCTDCESFLSINSIIIVESRYHAIINYSPSHLADTSAITYASAINHAVQMAAVTVPDCQAGRTSNTGRWSRAAL